VLVTVLISVSRLASQQRRPPHHAFNLDGGMLRQCDGTDLLKHGVVRCAMHRPPLCVTVATCSGDGAVILYFVLLAKHFVVMSCL